MKANSILKIAVVAMAAFGAYAFSGNNAQQSFYIHDEEQCVRNMTQECSTVGNVQCKILIGLDEVDVWSDTQCSKPAYFL